MPTNFATEGTPAQFSRNESLSDLSDVGEEAAKNDQVASRDNTINEGELKINRLVLLWGSFAEYRNADRNTFDPFRFWTCYK